MPFKNTSNVFLLSLFQKRITVFSTKNDCLLSMKLVANYFRKELKSSRIKILILWFLLFTMVARTFFIIHSRKRIWIISGRCTLANFFLVLQFSKFLPSSFFHCFFIMHGKYNLDYSMQYKINKLSLKKLILSSFVYEIVFNLVFLLCPFFY